MNRILREWKRFAAAALLAATTGSHAAFADGFSNGTTENRPLRVRNSSLGFEKSYNTKNTTDWTLDGTGLSGTVANGGDHWIVTITGGSLSGFIRTDAGLEVRLAGTQTGISCSVSQNPLYGYGGVRILGPGVLHIDQNSDYAAIYGGKGAVTVALGAVVGVNGLGNSTAVSGTGVRVLASALHVNATGGIGINCNGGGFEIGESIVTVAAKKTAVYAEGTNSTVAVSASSVHLFSSTSTALRCGDDIFAGPNAMWVANSVFCALGAGHGVQGKLSGLGTFMKFENVVGAIIGCDCGIYAASEIDVSGGSTKLSVAGNLLGEHSPDDLDAVSLLAGDSSSGQAIRMLSPTRSFYVQEAGSVKLFSPGSCGLSSGTNIVAGGKLEVPGKASYGDFQTLFTWQGALAAAEVFMGRSLFDSDVFLADFFETQALAGLLAPTAALFADKAGRTFKGIQSEFLSVSGGQVLVEAAGTGIMLGGSLWTKEGYFQQTGGEVSATGGRVGIADADAANGYTSSQSEKSGILLQGGRLVARGGWDGVLMCGYVFQQGGTLEAAATGGYAAGTVSQDPGLAGYAVSANHGFAIEGGSFVATGGELRTAPNTSGAHDFALVHPCDLAVSGTNAPVEVSDMVPSWYGVNDLYPIGGNLRFWLPEGEASLSCDGVSYTANGTGQVVAGSNRFVAASGAVVPVALSISGPDSVESGADASYSCTAEFSDGSRGAVDAAWSIASGAAFGQIGTGGTFSAAETVAGGTVVVRAEYGGLQAEKSVEVLAAPPAMQTVFFDANGGSCTTDRLVYPVGGRYTNLPTATLAGHGFAGWFTEIDGGTRIDASSVVTADAERTLHAQWKAKTGQVSAFTREDGAWRVQFSGKSEKLYRLQRTGSLEAPWVTISRLKASEDGEVLMPDTLPEGTASGFYRLAEGEETAENLYMVVDMSGGPDAAVWPVEYLDAIPEDGWTQPYKTSKLVMRRIEAGTFTMGSPEDELGRDSDEVRHEVTLTKPFYIGVFEVTQRQWELAMGTRPSFFSNPDCYASRPVELVGYSDIRGASAGLGWPATDEVDSWSFLGVLRKKTGLPFTLPTEAEWEYSCRAGAATALNSGLNLVSTNVCPHMAAVGRYYRNGGEFREAACDTTEGTATVGSYAPNAWGLYDMHGNVLEWCLDWCEDYPAGAAVDPPGPAVPSGTAMRAMRGGSVGGEVILCRSAARCAAPETGLTSAGIGFRLCCGTAVNP